MSLRLEEAYKKLEERAIQLINIQDYTQSILRSITSGVLTVGPDGSVTTVNPAAERMLGVAEYDMVPQADRSGLRGRRWAVSGCRQGALRAACRLAARDHARDA